MIRSTTENTSTLETVREQFAAWRSNRTKKCEEITALDRATSMPLE